MNDFMTVQEAAEKWSLSVRRVQVLCARGRIEGAFKYASVWAIPKDSTKPIDERIIHGKYKKST